MNRILTAGVLALALCAPVAAHAASSPVLPAEDQSQQDRFCRDEWTKRGVLNEEMHDYCMGQQRDGYDELTRTATKYKDLPWIQDMVDNAVAQWTKAGIRNDQMTGYELAKQLDSFEDLVYEAKQSTFDPNRFANCYGFPNGRLRPIEASKIVVCYVRNTSTPAVR